MTDIVLAIGDPDDMDWKNHFADVRVGNQKGLKQRILLADSAEDITSACVVHELLESLGVCWLPGHAPECLVAHQTPPISQTKLCAPSK